MFVDAANHLTKRAAREAGEMAADALAPALRAAIASEARVEAAKAVKKLATDRRTAAAWKATSKAERDAAQRSILYEHVDRLYKEAEKNAKRALKDAEKALKKNANDAAAIEQRNTAEARVHGVARAAH